MTTKTSFRILQVNELLKEEIGEILLQKMQDPRLEGLSITEVRTSKDLQHAQVFVSCLGDAGRRQVTQDVLKRSAGHIRHLLGQCVRLKYTPELRFTMDDSYDRANRILEILKHVDLGNEEEPSTDGKQ
ncbi:MAG: 30S ribosome-binding factor RbfA [bacterium]